MATDALISGLTADDWSVVLAAVVEAEKALGSPMRAELELDRVIRELVRLAGHSKWEIRRAVANVAGQVLDPAFEEPLAKLSVDDNARVRQAAERASLRRRDWHNASLLGRQHAERINATLDDIEARYGVMGREAVKRASAQIANTFARELYHEVIKLLSPIAVSVERFHTKVSSEDSNVPELAVETERMGRRVAHLRAVLDSMRAYTDQPQLAFESSSLADVVEEAVSLVRDTHKATKIVVDGGADITANIARSRLLQALVNVLTNAAESESTKPIRVHYQLRNDQIDISIQDFGCGMSDEVLKDAPVLFATSKANGTGFGLPLAIKIVESAHAGRLTLESVKGKGTTVKIVLPLTTSRASR